MRPADIGCPSYAPSLSTAGHVSITGNVSANKFIGDGSGLTNLSVQGDRITSNTHSVIVDEGTGYVSLTTSGGTWGYFSSGWSYLSNLFTNTVSSSLVSATNISATYVDATRNGAVSATYGYFRYISGTDIYGRFTGDGSGLTGVIAGSGDRIVSGSAGGTRMVAISDTGYISITQAGANSGWFDPTRGLVTLGVSSTGSISGSHGYFGGKIGIGTGLTAPLWPIHVSGTFPIVMLDHAAAGASNAAFHFAENGATRWAISNLNGTYASRPELQNALTFYQTSNKAGATLNAYRMVINDEGNVGIGTTAPNAALQVSGTFVVSTSSQGANSPSLFVASNGAVGVGTSSPSLGAFPTMLHVMRPNNAWGLIVDGEGATQSDIIMRTRGNASDQRLLQTVNVLNKVYMRSLSDAIAVRFNYWTADLATGALGISNTSPLAKLDVNGTISSSDAIQVGQSTLACATGLSGSIRFNTTSDTLQVCTGFGWKSLVSGTAGAGTLTGTGSATAVAFWNGASGLAYDTDGFYWDSSNNRLGIGTNAPSATLNISATLPVLAIDRRAGAFGMLHYRTNGTLRWSLFADQSAESGSEAGSNFGINAYDDAGAYISTPLMVRRATGNVGIQNLAPTATLQVSGSFIVSSTDTGVSPSLYVSTSGRVGIRTMNPQGHLHIATDDATSSLYLSRAGDLTSAINFASSLGDSLIAGGGSSGNLRFFSAGGQRMVISSAGNVGIGAPLLPAVSLSVVGEVQVSNSGVVCGSTTRGAIRYTQSGGVLSYCNGSIWTTLGAAGGGQEDRIVSGTTNAIAHQDRSLTVSTAGSQRMIVGENGRVGIGTDTPLAKVHITNDGNGAVWVTSANGANYSTLNFGVNTTSGLTWFNSTGVGTGAINPIGFGLGGSERFRISNASISTTVPLIVSGTISASDAVQVGQSTLSCANGISGSIRYNTTSDTLQICTGSGWKSLVSGTAGVGTLSGTGSATAVAYWSGANGLTFDTDGFYWDATNNRLGIGTNSPSSAIEISKTGYVRMYDVGSIRTFRPTSTSAQSLFDVSSNAGGADYSLFTVRGNGNVGVGTGDAAPPAATLHVSGSFIVSTSAQTTTPSLYVGTNGNVGIGTSSPGTKLEVSGSIATAAGSGGRITAFDATAANNRVIMGADASGGYLQGTYGSGGTGTLRFLNINAEGMRLSGGRLGISNTNPIAKLDVNGTISASDAIQVGASELVCSSAISGSIRYSTTSSTLEYCNSTAWTSLGPSDTQVVSFKVNKNGTNQTVTASTWTKLTWSSEVFDTNNNFDTGTSRFTPTVPGKYLVYLTVHCSGGGDCQAGIYKNGAQNSFSITNRAANSFAYATTIIEMNGTTDYLEGWANSAGTTIGGGAVNTHFEGSLLGPQSGVGGGGGTANPAGGAGDIQFNDGSNLAADTGQFFWDATNNRLGLGNADPSYTLDVTGIVRSSSYGMFGTGTGAGSYIVGNNTYGLYRSNISNGYLGFPSNGVLSLMNANIGISTTTPLAKLDVVGTISASDAIQPGTSSLTCSTGIAGALRYNTASNTVQVCAGASGWKSLVSGTTATILSELTDTQITNVAGRDYLRYDAVTSKWVNISESSVMSTTTMSSGWPDALRCRRSNGDWSIMYLNWSPSGTDFYYYNGEGYYNVFNPDGSYKTNNNYTPHASGGCNKNISQLYIDGQAFNFIGNANTNSTAEGDRITSGTLAMVANSTTSYVSLSTAGTTWGYFNSVLSYLPTLSAARVSSTNVSATLLQLGTGNGANCDAGHSGAIRYSTTSSTVEYCNSTAWVSMGPSDTVPVSFRVHKNGNNQTVTTSTYTKVSFATEVTDSNNNFAACTTNCNSGAQTANESRFTPTVPGRYLFTANVGCSSSTGCHAVLYKNGARILDGSWAVTASGANYSHVSGILEMNGTSDYVELWGHNAGGTTLLGTATNTHFEAALLGPQVGGAGGGATSLAGLSDVDTSGASTGKILSFNGTQWVVSDSAPGTLAGLLDASITSVAGRDYLRYDSVSGKWVNISESAVMSTTTMENGFPDAIVCPRSDSGTAVFYLLNTVNAGRILYGAPGGDWVIYFNRTTGLFDSSAGSNIGTYVSAASGGCRNAGTSLANLYAAGRAFNFIGNAATGGDALGDRITSGTLAMVANSDTSYVSLSTAGTAWGYFSSVLSYLPTLTATRVSATNISATLATINGGTITTLVGAGGNSINSGTSNVTVSENTSITLSTGGNQRMIVTPAGLVGIGTSTPGEELDVASSGPVIRLTDNNSTGAAVTAFIEIRDQTGTRTGYMGDGGSGNANIYINSDGGSVIATAGANACTYTSGASWSCSSDERMKDQIMPLTNSLEKLVKLQGVSYHWRDPSKAGKKHVGLIAQQVRIVFPEMVSKDDDTGMLQLDYAAFVSPIIEAIKELASKVARNDTDIASLKAANDNLEVKLKSANDNVQMLGSAVDDLRRELRELKQANNK